MALSSLPDDLVGHIFSMLKPHKASGRESRQAFFSCCKMLRTSSAVHAQFNTLTISADQLQPGSNTSLHSSNPFLCFPRGAHLKKLVLRRGEGDSMPGAGNLLLRLLQPESSESGHTFWAHPRIVTVLGDLKEILMEGFPLKEMEASKLGTVFNSHSRLQTLKIASYNGTHDYFLAALAGPDGKCEVRDVQINPEMDLSTQAYKDDFARSIKGIGMFEGLVSLSLIVPAAHWSASALSALQCLSQLKHLSIAIADDFTFDYEDVDLDFIFTQMPNLQCLAMPGLPTETEITAMAGTLTQLVLNTLYDVEDMCCLLTLIKAKIASFPNLQAIGFACLDFCDCELGCLDMLSECIDALKHVEFSLQAVYGVPHFDDFFDLCAKCKPLMRSLKRIESVDLSSFGDSKVASVATFKRLASTCPHLTGIQVFTGYLIGHEDCLHGACELSNLQGLRLVDEYYLQPGMMLSNGELSLLAWSLSTKHGCPLTLELEVNCNAVHSSVGPGDIEAAFDQMIRCSVIQGCLVREF